MINKLSIIFFGIEWHAARLEWSSFVFFVLDSAGKKYKQREWKADKLPKLIHTF